MESSPAPLQSENTEEMWPAKMHAALAKFNKSSLAATKAYEATQSLAESPKGHPRLFRRAA